MEVQTSLYYELKRMPAGEDGHGGEGKDDLFPLREFGEEAAFVQIDVLRKFVGTGEGGTFHDGVGAAGF